MRSTRASAAVARLNERCPGHHYRMVLLGSGEFRLRQQGEGGDQDVGPALPLDEFVKFVNAQGPQQAPRITKNDAAFARQLVRKTPPKEQ